MRNVKPVLLVLALVLIISVLCSCGTGNWAAYEEAEVLLTNGDYEQAVVKADEAIALTKNSQGDTKGEFWLVRAQANMALGNFDEAVSDYKSAIDRGNDFSDSYGLRSDPDPYAQAKWFRNFSLYYNSLGIALVKAGNYQEALIAFNTAINVAAYSLGATDITGSVVGALLGGQKEEVQAYAKTVGAFYYNSGLMEEKTGADDAGKAERETAEQLNYDQTLIVSLE